MTTKSKKLIINADDFGLHESINDSVEKAYQKGMLTSASLVANGDAFCGAVDIARRCKGLGVGIHLALVGEKPVAPAGKISSIVNGKGFLPDRHVQLCRDIISNKVDLSHIALETEAQILKFTGSGLVPTHVDSHQHLHLFPPIFNAINPVLERYNIRKIRKLNIPWFDYRRTSLMKVAFALFTKYSRLPENSNYRSPDYFLGFFNSGNVDTRYFEGILPKVKEGTTEIGVHPGIDNELIGKKYGSWKERDGWGGNWSREYKLLLCPNIREKIDMNNIALINYSDI